MRVHFVMLLSVALVSGPALAQTTAEPTPGQAAIVGLVQKAVVRALTFDRGDLERLRGVRHDFTPEGFVASGDPTIVSQSDGVLHITIPGTLKHSQNGSSTTYRVVVEVQAAGQPMKIAHLKQRMCGGSTATPCK
jgi:hypothetical protein